MKSKMKGFTLAEMLIVVAIIGVLISILIPTFSGQLEKARETTDAANLREAMAEAIYKATVNGNYEPIAVKMTQKKDSCWDCVTSINGIYTVYANANGQPQQFYFPEGGARISCRIPRNTSGTIWVKSNAEGYLQFSRDNKNWT